MVYSQFYLKNQTKIPSLIAALFVFLIGIFFIRLFAKSSIPSKAEKKSIKRVEVANISSNQAVVVWQTDQKDVGWVIFGENANRLNKLAYDERDLASNKSTFLSHYVILRNLNEGKTYYFKLISNNHVISNNGTGIFSFKTVKASSDFRNRGPAYGKIIQSNGAPLENTVVLVHIGNSFPLATLTKTTGEWLVPLTSLYDKDTYLQFNPGNKDKITIDVLGDNKFSQVITDFSKISPLPQSIIIGTNFDFTTSENVLSATSSRTIEKAGKEIDILYPRENALIPGYDPLIKGIALPNSDVFISIHSSTEISSKVKSDNKGIWTLHLPSRLSPGDHVITIRTPDRNGNIVIT